MFGNDYRCPPHADTNLITPVVAILDKYFDSLESNTSDSLMPIPFYRWAWYRGEMTIERLRKGITILDEYWAAGPQHQWAEHNEWNNGVSRGRKQEVAFDAGPDLNRLPDGALISMFQELDRLFAEYEKQNP